MYSPDSGLANSIKLTVGEGELLPLLGEIIVETDFTAVGTGSPEESNRFASTP